MHERAAGEVAELLHLERAQGGGAGDEALHVVEVAADVDGHPLVPQLAIGLQPVLAHRRSVSYSCRWARAIVSQPCSSSASRRAAMARVARRAGSPSSAASASWSACGSSRGTSAAAPAAATSRNPPTSVTTS